MNTPIPIPAQVFVVDDDEAVRDSIKILLEVHGFAVEDFASITEFAKGYRSREQPAAIATLRAPSAIAPVAAPPAI
jgi:two-component system, LuxR family, response regulator FixJ